VERRLLKEEVVGLVDRYPLMFESLVLWLKSRESMGNFQINRAQNSAKLRYNISRHYEDG
jgi:hypothetical protein